MYLEFFFRKKGLCDDQGTFFVSFTEQDDGVTLALRFSE
jgi:hypothetical protein